MAIIPIKVLKDKNQVAFLPFTITDAVFLPDSDETVTDFLEEQVERIDEAIESVPTKTSDLTNDSGFIEDANYVHTDNNYTDNEKNKLSGITAGAEVNVLEKVKVNGTEQTITNKAVDIFVPTKVSDIINDLAFINNTVNNLVNYYTKTEVDNKISSVYKYKGSVNTYADLPSSGQVVGDVYNVVTADTTHGIPAGGNVAWNGTAWDYLGGDIDLSNYYTKTQVDTSLNGKVDKVTGKQLSTEDYTSAEKTKLSNIEANAEVNLIESISVNNTTVSPVNKNVNITVPTTLASLTDDATHRTVSDTDIDNWNAKQDELVSNVNIRTVNGNSLLGSGDIAIASDESIVIIKDMCNTLPATTGYTEGDNINLVTEETNGNDTTYINSIYMLSSGAWVNKGAPDPNKYYLLVNDYYESTYDWKYTRGIYKVDTYGYISEKLTDYTFFVGGNLYFENLKSGTYFDFNNTSFSYPTIGTQRTSITIPFMSTISIYKHSEITLTVGDMFLIHTADNKTMMGTITAINTNPIIGGVTWSVNNYYDPLRIRKSTDTDVAAINMHKLFKDAAMSPTKTLLWIVGNTFTLNYTEFGTQASKSFTFNENDMVQGNSVDCVSGTPMIIYKTNGERYKVTNLTSTGDTYLITKLDEEVYSTSEQRIGVWTDGKDLYRKTIVAPGPFTSKNTQTISISNLGAETVMIDYAHSFFHFDDPNNNYTGPFDSPACIYGTTAMKAGTIAITDINHNDNEIGLYIGNNSLNDATLILYITLEYTKTTN